MNTFISKFPPWRTTLFIKFPIITTDTSFTKPPRVFHWSCFALITCIQIIPFKHRLVSCTIKGRIIWIKASNIWVTDFFTTLTLLKPITNETISFLWIEIWARKTCTLRDIMWARISPRYHIDSTTFGCICITIIKTFLDISATRDLKTWSFFAASV